MPFDSAEGKSGISFKDFIRYRKAQGYNGIAVISCFPTWSEDDLGWRVVVDGTVVRSSGDMWRTLDGMDEAGNRPFAMRPEPELSGRPVVADFWRLNPAYFQSLDRKMQLLSDEGFVPFFETIRRDAGHSLERWTPEWRSAFARYLQYLIARYGAYNIIFSALHYDWEVDTMSAEDWKSAIDLHYNTYGLPPFGQTMTVLTSDATHTEWGHATPWLMLHGVGNEGPRNNRFARWIFEQFQLPDPKPSLNQEPVYPGRSTQSREPALSNAWTSVLAGGFAGHIHGSQYYSGVLAKDALDYKAVAAIPHIRTFLLSCGSHYQRLIPRTEPRDEYFGQGIFASTTSGDLAMGYFQKSSRIQDPPILTPSADYEATWFNPDTGLFGVPTHLTTDAEGRLQLSPFPDGKTDARQHWAIRLVRASSHPTSK